MDETRFDDIAKALGMQTTRRLTISALLGGTLGILGFTEMTSAASGKCKQDCGECKTCKKGKCQTKNGKKTCKKGTCQSKAEGASCASPTGGTCQAGRCACPAGNVLCDGVCQAGRRCACPEGTEFCGGVCQGPCPLGQRRDPGERAVRDLAGQAVRGGAQRGDEDGDLRGARWERHLGTGG